MGSWAKRLENADEYETAVRIRRAISNAGWGFFIRWSRMEDERIFSHDE